MNAVRHALAILSWPFAPLLWGYFFLLKLVNGGRVIPLMWVTPPKQDDIYAVCIHYSCWLVWGAVTFPGLTSKKPGHVFTRYDERLMRSGKDWHRLMRHEFGHLPQWAKYGRVGFLQRWLYWIIRVGHDKNPLEMEATANAGSAQYA